MKINLALVWTMITGTALGIVYIFTSFATVNDTQRLENEHSLFVAVEDFKQFSVEVYYDQFYSVLDRRDHAEEDGNHQLVAELNRRLEKLKAKICSIEPQWERCDD